ncbi:MAG TPA: type II toxin-antitoxin system PemK/MazF family toxin [Tepidisphaeraceae bacterium]
MSEHPAIHPFDVYLVQLDPAIGVEMRKARPCVIVSPEIMHRHVRTVIVAPLTSHPKQYPTRVRCRFAGRPGEVALDHVRAVDRSRLLKRLGTIDGPTAARVRVGLVNMFK